MKDPVMGISAILSVFLTTVYFIAFFTWKRRRKRIRDNDLPGVSIVVPAYNEGKNIGDTIESLLNLDYPKDRLEIIVVDDGSTDNTYDVARQYEGKNVRIIRKENGGKSSALNVGIRAAKYDIIACMDADSVATGDSLKKLVSYLVEEDADAVTPVMHVWRPKNLIERFQWAEYILSNVLRRALDAMHAQYVTPGPFSVFKKRAFERYGYFEEGNIAEDMEFAMRIQAEGGKLVHASDAIVYTKVPRTIKGLIKQRIRWYMGFLENTWRYMGKLWKRGGDLGMFVFPAVFLGLGITFLLAYKMLLSAVKDIQISVATVAKGGIWSLINLNEFTVERLVSNIVFTVTSFPAVYYTALFITITTIAMIVYYSKRTREPRIYWSGIALLVFGYFIFMVVVWSIILWLKLFGKELRFGGTVWRNSVLNKLVGRYTGQQGSPQ